MGRRILNDALRAIVNAERRGKATVELQPISTVMSSFLNIMKYRAYFPGLSLHPDCIRKVVDEREFWTEQVACLHFINASIHVLDHAI